MCRTDRMKEQESKTYSRVLCVCARVYFSGPLYFRNLAYLGGARLVRMHLAIFRGDIFVLRLPFHGFFFFFFFLIFRMLKIIN